MLSEPTTDESLDDGIYGALAAQDSLLRGTDAKRFAVGIDAEVAAALQYAASRLTLGKPPVCIGTGMIVSAGMLLRTIFTREEFRAAAKTFAAILEDVIAEGPEQPCLPFGAGLP